MEGPAYPLSPWETGAGEPQILSQSENKVRPCLGVRGIKEAWGKEKKEGRRERGMEGAEEEESQEFLSKLFPVVSFSVSVLKDKYLGPFSPPPRAQF